MIKIDLPFPNLHDRTIFNLKECYIQLSSNYFDYKVIVEYNELDEDTGLWIYKKAYNRERHLVSSVCGMSMIYVNSDDKWCVQLTMNGDRGNPPIGWYFEKSKDALSLYNIMCKWIAGEYIGIEEETKIGK